jgi:hypothetical protein
MCNILYLALQMGSIAHNQRSYLKTKIWEATKVCFGEAFRAGERIQEVCETLLESDCYRAVGSEPYARDQYRGLLAACLGFPSDVECLEVPATKLAFVELQASYNLRDLEMVDVYECIHIEID